MRDIKSTKSRKLVYLGKNMTLTEMQDRLTLYLTAETKILEGNQSWTVGTKSFTRADLAEIARTIKSIRSEISIARNAGSYGCSQMVVGGRR